MKKQLLSWMLAALGTVTAMFGAETVIPAESPSLENKVQQVQTAQRKTYSKADMPFLVEKELYYGVEGNFFVIVGGNGDMTQKLEFNPDSLGIKSNLSLSGGVLFFRQRRNVNLESRVDLESFITQYEKYHDSKDKRYEFTNTDNFQVTDLTAWTYLARITSFELKPGETREIVLAYKERLNQATLTQIAPQKPDDFTVRMPDGTRYRGCIKYKLTQRDQKLKEVNLYLSNNYKRLPLCIEQFYETGKSTCYLKRITYANGQKHNLYK